VKKMAQERRSGNTEILLAIQGMEVKVDTVVEDTKGNSDKLDRILDPEEGLYPKVELNTAHRKKIQKNITWGLRAVYTAVVGIAAYVIRNLFTILI
jgi:hypothetical protein